jgi:hypothetical protein
MPDTAQDLAAWLAYIGAADCACTWEWRNDLGHLYGQSIGPGWSRTDTNPACADHRAPQANQ